MASEVVLSIAKGKGEERENGLGNNGFSFLYERGLSLFSRSLFLVLGEARGSGVPPSFRPLFSPFGLGFSKAQFEGEVDPVQCRDRITIEAEGEKWSDSRDNSVRICYANLTRSYFVWFCGL